MRVHCIYDHYSRLFIPIFQDLTRQLQQVRRKLENYEVTSNGDKDTMSLGSRTSSNGSLNTVGLPEQNNVSMTTPNVAVHNQPVQQVKQPSPEQVGNRYTLLQ